MIADSFNALTLDEIDLLILEKLFKSKVMTSQLLEWKHKILFVLLLDLLILSSCSCILLFNIGLDLRIQFPLLRQIRSSSPHLQCFILSKLLFDKLRIRAGGSFGRRWDEEASLLDDVFGNVGGSGGKEEEIIVANQAEHLNLN